MGAEKNKKLEKRDARPGGWRPKTSGNTGPADWAGINPRTVLDTIAAVAAKGGALRFGYTRDGGAYALGVYGDGEPRTVYLKPSDDVEGVLDDLREYFAEIL